MQDARKALGGELGAAGLRAEQGEGEHTEAGGVAMGGSCRGVLLGGRFFNICHPKDCGCPTPLDAWDSSPWPLCTSQGT